MSRREGQKIKLVALLRVLLQKSDQEHPMSVPKILQELADQGVQAERKSVYDDIQTLRDLGLPVVLRRGRGGGYFLAEWPFQTVELKLLVDAVQSNRFITQEKSRALIQKLMQCTSEGEAAKLKRQVLVSGRLKAQEERIYYWVDQLHKAIEQECQIQFVYREWSLKGRLVPRHGGKLYRVSPWALVWESGNYYLIAYAADQGLRHYRVDKLDQVRLLEQKPREGAEAFASFDVTRYVQQMFGMFHGEVQQVTLRCKNDLAGAMIDRFGLAPIRMPEPEGEHFKMDVTVQVSPQFYGWVAGFGGGVEVLAPAQVRRELAQTLRRMADQYADVPQDGSPAL